MDNDAETNARTLYAPRKVAHPGEIVIDYLEFNEWSQRDLARRTGLTPKTISEICSGKASISPPTSLALEKVFGRPARFWLSLQQQYDEAAARRQVAERKTGWTDWASRFPLRDMRRYGYLGGARAKESDVDALLEFFGVSSPDSWDSVWQALTVSYRQTRKVRSTPEAISAWVRATELVAISAASKLEIQDFDEARLRASLNTLRAQTRRRADEIMPTVQSVCGAAGVIVVWVPELPLTGISGCARWLSTTKALVALTLRYKTDDQMWFTFFHEIGHVLLHKRTRSFVLDNAAEDLSDRVVDPQMQQEEDEANRFAADTLIPPDALHEFLKADDFGNDAIHSFAEEQGIGPGIIVGRLQRDGVLAPHQGNRLKQRLDWKVNSD